MDRNIEERFYDLFEDILGENKNGRSYGLWTQWNCPKCSEMNHYENDNKFNLEISFEKNIYHCWKCGESENTKGKLNKLVKEFGTYSQYNEYKNILKEYIETSLYDTDRVDDIETLKEEFSVDLPEKCFKIDKDNYFSQGAYNYLISRGITDDIIEKYNIMYVGNSYNSNIIMKNRIIIPSYDKFGNLQYWTGRDYTGNSKLKYFNVVANKKEIIFNESLINYYEDIILCEGVMDSIVLYNSIPLLGKTLTKDSLLYNELVNKAKANVIIFLDGDAFENTKIIYNLLNNSKLNGRVRYIFSEENEDPSDIYEKRGMCGILEKLKEQRVFSDLELSSLYVR